MRKFWIGFATGASIVAVYVATVVWYTKKYGPRGEYPVDGYRAEDHEDEFYDEEVAEDMDKVD